MFILLYITFFIILLDKADKNHFWRIRLPANSVWRSLVEWIFRPVLIHVRFFATPGFVSCLFVSWFPLFCITGVSLAVCLVWFFASVCLCRALAMLWIPRFFDSCVTLQRSLYTVCFPMDLTRNCYIGLF